jgi:hypothetical protein
MKGFKFLFFISLLIKILTETKKLDLNTQYTGSIDKDDNWETYELKIEKVESDQNLFIRVKERAVDDAGKGTFSDPDVYVSKVI